MVYNKKSLYKKCIKHNIEPLEVVKDNMIIFMCPKIPDKDTQLELLEDIPTVQYRFIEAPKVTTRDVLEILLKSIGFYGELQMKERKIIIKSTMKIDPNHPFWAEVQELLYKDGYFTEWEITLGDKSIICKKSVVEEVQKNVKRDHTISKDDILNLQIVLGNKRDVLDIIKDL